MIAGGWYGIATGIAAIVTIDFMSADGIVPGRTPVRYQGVEVGTVEDVQPEQENLRKN